MAEIVTTTEALKKLDSQLECSLCLDDFRACLEPVEKVLKDSKISKN